MRLFSTEVQQLSAAHSDIGREEEEEREIGSGTE
jgi:hypothetical protein